MASPTTPPNTPAASRPPTPVATTSDSASSLTLHTTAPSPSAAASPAPSPSAALESSWPLQGSAPGGQGQGRAPGRRSPRGGYIPVVRIDPAEVRRVSMAWTARYASWHDHCRYLGMDNEHYKLLSYVAQQFRKALFVDVGTYLGHSALALAADAPRLGNRVITYDLADHVAEHLARHPPPVQLHPPPVQHPGAQQQQPHKPETVRDAPGVDVRLRDCLPDLPTLATQAKVIMLDVTPHDGQFERTVITALTKHGFRGLLFLDDIRLNPAMELMWSWVPHKKLDLTSCGHWSGTGVVVFDPAALDVQLVPPEGDPPPRRPLLGGGAKDSRG